MFVLGRGRPEDLSESEAVEKEGELEGSGQEGVSDRGGGGNDGKVSGAGCPGTGLRREQAWE